MVFHFSLHGLEDLSIPAGHFVVICNEAQGLPWRTAAGNNQKAYGVTIGRIQDNDDIPNAPYMHFFCLQRSTFLRRKTPLKQSWQVHVLEYKK